MAGGGPFTASSTGRTGSEREVLAASRGSSPCCCLLTIVHTYVNLTSTLTTKADSTND